MTHRRKLGADRLGAIFDAIDELQLVTDSESPNARDLAGLARRLSLSAYDATYIELALRLKVPLAAKDLPLVEAASRAGIAMA